eukprot:362174-Chlamydomonas_euryale.AAC.5
MRGRVAAAAVAPDAGQASFSVAQVATDSGDPSTAAVQSKGVPPGSRGSGGGSGDAAGVSASAACPALPAAIGAAGGDGACNMPLHEQLTGMPGGTARAAQRASIRGSPTAGADAGLAPAAREPSCGGHHEARPLASTHGCVGEQHSSGQQDGTGSGSHGRGSHQGLRSGQGSNEPRQGSGNSGSNGGAHGSGGGGGDGDGSGGGNAARREREGADQDAGLAVSAIAERVLPLG